MSEKIYDFNGTEINIANEVDIPDCKADIPKLYITGGMLPQTKDEGKVKFKVQYVSGKLSFSEYCTLKVQGAVSTIFPKKNYNIQFFKDAAYSKKSKHDFCGWGDESKYTLKANWTDISHTRNVITARLWTDMVRQRSNYDELPTELLESPKLGVIDGFTVLVYFNGIYQGRYTLNIPKDKWMYNMDDGLETNVVLYGEGAGDESSAFRAEAMVDGHDWTDEIHEDEVPQSVITRFNAFIDFVINSTDQEFITGLSDYVDIESLIDTDILAWVDCGVDSIGKNEIFMSYDGIKYICSVYDLDTTWGADWYGEFIYPANYAITESAFSESLLHNRLRELFPERIKARYAKLRENALSETNIVKKFSEFMENLPRTLIEEDWAITTANGAFTDMPEKNTNTVQRIRQYVVDRLEYLDDELENYYPKITAVFDTDGDAVYADYDLNSLKPYLTVKYFENENDTGTVVPSSDYQLLGNLVVGTASIQAFYNGFSTRFNVTAIDFYDQRQWSMSGGNANIRVGSQNRKIIWSFYQLTTHNYNNRRLAVTNRGVRVYVDDETDKDLDGVYPIPVPADVTEITISVTPSTLEIKPSLWEYRGGKNRYQRSQDPGILGAGTITWSNIVRSEEYDEYLCVEFKRPQGGDFQPVDEISDFNITYS